MNGIVRDEKARGIDFRTILRRSNSKRDALSRYASLIIPTDKCGASAVALAVQTALNALDNLTNRKG